MSEPATDSQTDTPPTDRLVIRIKMVTEEEPPPPPPAWDLSKAAMVLIGGVAAVVLGWFSIGSLRSDPPPPPAVVASAPSAGTQPLPKPEPEVSQSPDAPTAAINEVVPDVTQSALATIRGTIRVVVRVTLDKQGAVVAATPDDRGPSRYFARLSVDASKKWTFTPAKSEDQRTMLLRFNFTRYGATANASPVQ